MTGSSESGQSTILGIARRNGSGISARTCTNTTKAEGTGDHGSSNKAKKMFHGLNFYHTTVVWESAAIGVATSGA